MKDLFEETKLGSIKLKNRFVRSATWENLATDTGHMTKELYGVYKKLAESEVGLIITGYANVIEEEKPNPGMMGIYNDSFIPEYKKLTDSVHEFGSKIIMQVAYGGTKTTFNVGKRLIYAPGDIPERSTQVAGKPMTKEEIKLVVNFFADAAGRIKEAGFDGIEIHGAHSYLINQFLSPYYNNRTDEYGVSLKNRMRFLTDIYNQIRERVGAEFCILVKLTCTEFFEGGLSLQETIEICKELEMLGVDGVEITGNIHAKANQMTGENFEGYQLQKEGYFTEFAKIISEEIHIPVLTVGGFRDVNYMDKLLKESKLEYFALSRPLLAEPELIKRWKNGDKQKAICISCSKCRTKEGNYCVVFEKRNRQQVTY